MPPLFSVDFYDGVVEELRRHSLAETLPSFGLTPREGKRIEGEFRGIRLSSAFQPIFRANGGEATGFEALLRASDASGSAISPEKVFAMSKDPRDLVCLDRLARVMHTANYLAQGGDERSCCLFLNVHPRHLGRTAVEHGQFFETVLRHFAFSPAKIVLEVLESDVDDTRQLQGVIAKYSQLGFGIAIDDFGCRHSNFDRLWLLEPDIVKLDRSLVHLAARDRKMWRILSHIVKIVHELEAKVVCEGIETRDQLQRVRDAGVDWVQGYFLARPSAELSERATKPAAIEPRQPTAARPLPKRRIRRPEPGVDLAR